MSLETDLYSLFAPIIGGTVIFSDQNSPRPALPYSTLKYSSFRRIKLDRKSDVDEFGNQTVAGDREFTLTIQRFQNGGNDVVWKLQEVVNKLQWQTNIDKAVGLKIVPFWSSPVLDISALLDKTQIEKRATVDIFIRYRQKSVDNGVGIIDTANIAADDDSLAPPYTIIATSV